MKAKGLIIRSRAKWSEEGERCNKYFANLEKRNKKKSNIAILKLNENITITDRKKILQAIEDFYKALYSSKQKQFNEEKADIFLKSNNLPKLSDEDKQSCEGLLTKEECRLKRYE